MNYVLNKDLLHQKYFEEISKIPHGSYNEQQLSNYIVNIAKELGYKYIYFPDKPLQTFSLFYSHSVSVFLCHIYHI